MKLVRLVAAAAALTLAGGIAGTATGTGPPARAAGVRSAGVNATGETAPGFVYGTDSWPVTVRGSAPYQEPVTGGSYGGYIGMIGNWAYWYGCRGSFIAWSAANSQEANTNYRGYGTGIGTGAYWFMGGPGVDPDYNGTTGEAYGWGERQAARALSDVTAKQVTYPVIFIDVELPGIAPAPDNGWNDVYTSPCSGQVKASYIAPSVDRADFNGFWDYITSHSSYTPGVYSSPGTWSSIFGTGSASDIPGADEWTYEPETANLGQAPSGWCLTGTSACAEFFGGVTSSSPHALMWQWSGGGGVRNAYGDFDQIDVARARPAPPPSGTGAITGYAGRCVDDYHSGTAGGNKIDIYSCNGSAAQTWTLTPSGELRNSASGMCLNDAGYGGQGTKLIQWTCGAYSNEHWARTPAAQYKLAYNGLCLNDPGYSTADGTQLIIWACGSYANERWSLPS